MVCLRLQITDVLGQHVREEGNKLKKTPRIPIQIGSERFTLTIISTSSRLIRNAVILYQDIEKSLNE